MWDGNESAWQNGKTDDARTPRPRRAVPRGTIAAETAAAQEPETRDFGMDAAAIAAAIIDAATDATGASADNATETPGASTTPPADDAADEMPDDARFRPMPDEPRIAADATASDALTARQRVAIGMIVSGSTFAATAARLGIDAKTLFRWRQEPAFARTVDDLSRGALDATAARARSLLLQSTRVLGEALRGDDRFRWAIRVVNSRRLDLLAARLPGDPPTAPTPMEARP